jgi:hypothetical protein
MSSDCGCNHSLALCPTAFEAPAVVGFAPVQPLQWQLIEAWLNNTTEKLLKLN